jgi:hypothetical protein
MQHVTYLAAVAS